MSGQIPMMVDVVYLSGDEPEPQPVAPPESQADTRRRAFDSREPLVCCAFPGLNRKVGVAASPPFFHHGLKADYVDVSRETVYVNTTVYGSCYPAVETADRVRAATEATIAELDVVITELTAHRDRLVQDGESR